MKIYGSDNSDVVVNELGFALKKVGHTILQDIVLSNRLGFYLGVHLNMVNI